jgi:hypothetical protein
MASELREVWVVRDKGGRVVDVSDAVIHMSKVFPSNTVERLPLLTPEAAAVIEAAKAYEKSHWKWHDYLKLKKDRGDKASYRLVEAVRALHAARQGVQHGA